MNGSIMDLLLGAIQGNQDQTQVPYRPQSEVDPNVDPLTYNIMHQPVSYANDDTPDTQEIIVARNVGDRGQATLDKYLNTLDTAMLNQFGNKGGISNPMPEPVEGVDTDLQLAQGFDFRNRAAQKFFPKRYPRREEE